MTERKKTFEEFDFEEMLREEGLTVDDLATDLESDEYAEAVEYKDDDE